ncbi:hypothetical protein DM860_008507 [Cuscuta australis]|uniref:Uncharacterized protein n=1 Tax=Cuscuta australis TaxID=267555 RepID=A0A328D967_9ASTE|nr:hypothetical protein DM860_008507 [Cuscuta australis]
MLNHGRIYEAASTSPLIAEDEGDLHLQRALGTRANTINCLESNVDLKVNKTKRGKPEKPSTTLRPNIGDIGSENLPTWEWPGEDGVYDLTCSSLDLRL